MTVKEKLIDMLGTSPDLVQASKDEGRYEMLLSLIENDDVCIRVKDAAAEEIKCELVGKWLWDDDGVADIYSEKLFGTRVTEWDDETIKHYATMYADNYAD